MKSIWLWAISLRLYPLVIVEVSSTVWWYAENQNRLVCVLTINSGGISLYMCEILKCSGLGWPNLVLSGLGELLTYIIITSLKGLVLY